MKYEFHVGDYVETKTGTIGYVSKAPKKGLSYWTPIKLSYNDIRDEMYSVGDSYCIPFPLFPVYNDFNRIGQYDFTKKDEGKIKPLCEEYTKSFPLYGWDEIRAVTEPTHEECRTHKTTNNKR